MESETGLGPVETDTDSHRPLMSDEEDEVEVCGRTHQSVQQPDEPPAEPPQAIGFFQAFCLPGVIPVSAEHQQGLTNSFTNSISPHTLTLFLSLFGLQYSLAYACLKLVNYSFFFWLPFYLSNNYGWKEAEADRLSVWYDVGGIIGEWLFKPR